MQVNSASSFTPQSSGSLSVDNKNQVAEQRDRFRVQQAQQSTEQTEQSNKQSAQQTQDQNKQTAQVDRFDIDEQALALVEQAQFENQQAELNQSSSRTSTPTNNSISEQGSRSFSQQGTNQSSNQSSYDSPSKQNQTAIAAYSSVDSIAQRENIQQVFGIDLLV
jgi:hypothetical protein